MFVRASRRWAFACVFTFSCTFFVVGFDVGVALSSRFAEAFIRIWHVARALQGVAKPWTFDVDTRSFPLSLFRIFAHTRIL